MGWQPGRQNTIRGGSCQRFPHSRAFSLLSFPCISIKSSSFIDVQLYFHFLVSSTSASSTSSSSSLAAGWCYLCPNHVKSILYWNPWWAAAMPLVPAVLCGGLVYLLRGVWLNYTAVRRVPKHELELSSWTWTETERDGATADRFHFLHRLAYVFFFFLLPFRRANNAFIMLF